eukprot:Blabericola_migrator_1__405@NODE_10_length_25093_cov_104_131184_g7_i2_p12_GENE_NODE_10_length_25093_cov_104_131184_g7_i2NODE_10_length_25093_cov_104_131184_g7_i2_p12_ORF_typecomplete_len277_score36_91GCD14/PF08704_10/1_7e43GCD14_N/PF14801_6/1_6e06GCD14_N/PF14801_6/2e03Methyltransf_3/PF01596_17/6_7e06PCMT/PF01135_19/0_00021Methyltransf_31/PF13847_6/0_015Methyltransf_24/PF13578_6/0_013CMAS/PF02353_20/0_11_NODE_10_length_25093_cov_104_131184_g7_i21094311773
MKSFAEDGDYVILFSTHENLIKVKLTDAPGTITQYKGGKFKHQDIIGKRFGSRVPDHRNPNITAVLLPWTPELHSLSLDHRTQIVWGPDLSLISAYLDLRAGYTLVESGTGSGSASVNFARQLASGGHLHTFEFHSDRYLKAVKEFEDLGLGDVITCYNRNAYEDGFSEVKEGHPEFGTAKQKGVGKEEADGVFLDLPSPWLALAHADYILKVGNFLTRTHMNLRSQVVAWSSSPLASNKYKQFLKNCERWITMVSMSDHIPIPATHTHNIRHPGV